MAFTNPASSYLQLKSHDPMIDAVEHAYFYGTHWIRLEWASQDSYFKRLELAAKPGVALVSELGRGKLNSSVSRQR